MSSKKIYTTLGFDREVLERVESEAKKDRRSKSFLVEKIIREYYGLPWTEAEEVPKHALKA